MLAHELRNPLAPIRNAVQLLRFLGSDQPQLAAIRDMIDRQVNQMVRLVDDLLDISRITRGKIRLQMEPVDLGTVVLQAVETSRPLIDARKQRLIVHLPQEPMRIRADAVRVAQVLGNLLNNAAKYTEEGGQIWLTAERRAGDVVVRVRDTGMGIPREMLGTIFDLFTQVDRSLDRAQGGLGVGLTLVRRLVEMHGGKVEAHSAGPNRGSEFVVHLPALAEQEALEAANNQTADNSNGPPRRILVVDDNADAAESMGLLLRIAGHDVRIAHDGVAGLAAAQESLPDVVLLDIGLPGIDGYEVARRMRAQPGSEKVLLVALTGYGQEEDLRKSREAGFDHHLVKPVDPTSLSALLAAPKDAGPTCLKFPA
jgi:CheY-like chemotaxis protein